MCKIFEQTLHKGGTQMANKHLKPFTKKIKEIRSKTTGTDDYNLL